MLPKCNTQTYCCFRMHSASGIQCRIYQTHFFGNTKPHKSCERATVSYTCFRGWCTACLLHVLLMTSSQLLCVHNVTNYCRVQLTWLPICLSEQNRSCAKKHAHTKVQAYEEHVQELDRLRWIHEASQMQYITTLAWQAKQEAMLDSIRLTIHRASSLQVKFVAFCACKDDTQMHSSVVGQSYETKSR